MHAEEPERQPSRKRNARWTAQHLEINTAHYEEKCQVAGTPLERERGRELPEEIMPDAHAFLAYTVTELYEEKCRRVDPLFYFYFLIFIGVLLLYRAQ